MYFQIPRSIKHHLTPGAVVILFFFSFLFSIEYQGLGGLIPTRLYLGEERRKEDKPIHYNQSANLKDQGILTRKTDKNEQDKCAKGLVDINNLCNARRQHCRKSSKIIECECCT